MIQETARLIGYAKVVFLDDAAKSEDVVGKCCDYQAFLGEYDTAVAALGNNVSHAIGQKKLLSAMKIACPLCISL